MNISRQQFADQVAERSAPGYHYVQPEIYSLSAEEGAKVDIRLQGAYITEACLQRTVTLCGDADSSPAKLNASHGMTQKDRLSGQHGPGRWADWIEVHPRSHNNKDSEVLLEAVLPPGAIRLRRSFELHDQRSLVIESTVTNTSKKVSCQRLGEHLYFALPEGDLAGLQIVSHDLPLKDPDVREQVRADGWFWPGFDGDLIVQFPDKKLLLRSSVEIVSSEGQLLDSSDHPLGMMVWQRQGTESICLEPLWGYNERGTDVSDEGFTLAVGATAAMRTKISVIL